MKLSLLKGIASYLQGFKKLAYFRRVKSNLFVGEFDKHRIYFDLTKGQSDVFMCEGEILSTHIFHAPFDLKLNQYCTNAYIEEVNVDGDNRILIFSCVRMGSYKQMRFKLCLECTGKHTNVILLDEKNCVIEALRHISETKSSREVKVGKILLPLPQPIHLKPQESVPTPCEIPSILLEHYHLYATKNMQLKRENVLRSLQSKCNALKRKRDTLPSEEYFMNQSSLLAQWGKVLFASLHLLPTTKITSPTLVLKDFDDTLLEIAFPPQVRDLKEAGNLFFAQSKKFYKKAQNLFVQRENLQNKIDFLEAQIKCVRNVENLNDLEIFSSYGRDSKMRDYSSCQALGECFFIEGFKVSIGKNAKDNQRLLESAKADDMWLHIRDVPSAHLIIHCGKRKLKDSILQKCGEILVKLYASKKGSGNFVVDYTQRRFVKVSQNANVVYSKHQSLHYRV